MSRNYLKDAGAKDYVRLLLSFTVGVGVALAPYLGSVGVPGFRSLYSLMPVDIRDMALGASALVSGVVALYATTIWATARKSELRTWFKRWTWLALGGLALYCATLLTMVVPVGIQGGEETVRFSVGPFPRPLRPPCTAGISDARCIELITLNPARVRDMWGDRSVAMGQAAVLASYLGVIGAVGAFIGVAFGLRARAKARAITPPRGRGAASGTTAGTGD